MANPDGSGPASSVQRSPQFGKLIDGEAHRDAIHVATAPVIAAEQLSPGDHIGFVKDGDTTLVGASRAPIGVVDPFLRHVVMAGECFWLFLYPNTVTSLQHQWTHPAFGPAESTGKEASEAWMRRYADELGLSPGAVIEAAREYIRDGECHRLGHDLPNGIFDDKAALWRHYEVLTGERVPDETRDDVPFSCAC